MTSALPRHAGVKGCFSGHVQHGRRCRRKRAFLLHSAVFTSHLFRVVLTDSRGIFHLSMIPDYISFSSGIECVVLNTCTQSSASNGNWISGRFSLLKVYLQSLAWEKGLAPKLGTPFSLTFCLLGSSFGTLPVNFVSVLWKDLKTEGAIPEQLQVLQRAVGCICFALEPVSAHEET